MATLSVYIVDPGASCIAESVSAPLPPRAFGRLA